MHSPNTTSLGSSAKQSLLIIFHTTIIRWCPRGDSNPHAVKAQASETCVSTNSTTWATAEEDWSEVYVKDWFTTRTSNCLLGECINTINDLLEYSAYQLRKIPGLGNKSLREIEEYLSQNNLSFKGNKNV